MADLAKRKLNLIPIRAIDAWTLATTDAGSPRYDDLRKRKARIVARFILYVELPVGEVGLDDVTRWLEHLHERGLKPVTVYAMASQVSSFYKWAMTEPLSGIRFNPVRLARPKNLKPYQGESVKPLSRQQVRSLLSLARRKADGDDVSARRDYAILLFLFATGARRAEIVSLKWGDVEMGDTDAVLTRVKGGDAVRREVRDQRVWRALFDYLEASGRLESIEDGDPLWARHDSAARGMHQPVTARSIARNVKALAKEAGISGMWLHRTRHTVARDVSQRHGLAAAQEVLGHVNQRNTRIYTGRLAGTQDRYSSELLDYYLDE
jgi:integrase